MTRIGKRLAAVFLAVAMVNTFMPVLGTQTAYAAGSYTVTFDTHGGSSIDAQTVEEGGYAAKPDDPTKGDWSFGGWFTDDTYTNEFDFSGTEIRANTEIHAKWNLFLCAESYDVTNGQGQVGGRVSFDGIPTFTNSGSWYAEGEVVTLIASADEGYRFVGWSKMTSDGEIVSTDAEYSFTLSDPSVTYYYAIFESDGSVECTVSFNTYGGSSVPNQTIEKNGMAVKPADPTKDGCVFGGWYTDDTFTQEFEFSNTHIMSDTVIHAMWLQRITLAPYDITYNAIGYGGKLNVDSVDITGMYVFDCQEGKKITLHAEPSEKYLFVEWVKGDPSGEVVSTDKDYTFFVTGKATYYALFESTVVNVPAGKDLIYNGKEQVGVVADTRYTISGNTGTNAGSYTATLTLKDKTNYTWSDGTTADKKVKWTIAAKKITPSVTLSATAYTYNGKVKKPTVTVKDGSTKLAASQYTVTYASGRKNVGTYKVTVKMKGNYSGSKTVSFKINPKGATLSKVTKAKKAATVKWKKQAAKMSTSRITGYQIQLATDSKFTKNKKTVNVKGYSKTSKKVTGLKGGKKYYVRIRTYKKVGSTTYYSPWSKAKTVTTGK